MTYACLIVDPLFKRCKRPEGARKARKALRDGGKSCQVRVRLSLFGPGGGGGGVLLTCVIHGVNRGKLF